MGSSSRIAIALAMLLLTVTMVTPQFMPMSFAKVSDGKVLIIVLPNDVPQDPAKGNATIDAIALVNRLNYEGRVRLYMFPGNFAIRGKIVYAGSLLVIGDPSTIASIEEELSRLGIEYLEVNKSNVLVPLYYLKPAKIAVLDVGTTYTLHEVLKELGFRYTVLSAERIREGALVKEGYDVLILPPGSGTTEARLLGKEGVVRVAEFIYRGGGYVGICAGAYAPIKGYNEPTSWFQIVDAKLRNWPVWWLGTGIVRVEVTKPGNPVVFGFRDGFEAIYWNGPVLEPYDLGNDTVLGIDAPPYTELVRYVSTSHEPGAFSYGWGKLNRTYVDRVLANGSAVVLSYYGRGKIVLFSFHPELLSGDRSYAPKSVLPSKYNWRLLFNAIYYVSRSTILTVLNPIRGAWMWPSTFRYVVLDIYRHFNVSFDEAVRIGAELLAQELASYGITDLFIEVKSIRGYAFFPSKYIPAYPMWPYNTTNMFPALIEAMHRHGIRVHAWIPVFYDSEVWGPKDPVYHVGKAKSHWKPFPVTKYVRPANTTYLRVLAKFIGELLDMGFDGIHLDYIRYGHMVYSFAPADIERARARGINVTKVIDAIRRTFYRDYPGGYDPTYVWRLYLKGDKDIRAWFEMRREDIEHAIAFLAKAALSHRTRSGKEPILSAAVKAEATIDVHVPGTNFTIPGWEWQLLHYGQVWEDFAKYGYLLIPMAYFREYGQPIEWVKKVAESVVSVASRYGAPVAIGIQAWNVKLSEVKEEERLAIEGGAIGYVLFRWGTYRSIYRSSVSEVYAKQLEELRNTLLEVMSLASRAGVRDLQPLMMKLFALDAIESNHLYPEPEALLRSSYEVIDTVLSSVVKAMHEHLHHLKEVAKELNASLPALPQMEKLLGRAMTTNDVKTRIEYLRVVEDYLESMSSRLGIAKLHKLVNEVKQSIEELEKDVKDLSYRVSALQRVGSELSDLRSRMSILEKSVENLSNSLKNLGSRVTTLERVGSELRGLAKELSIVKSRVGNLSAEVSRLGYELTTLSSRVNELSRVASTPLPISLAIAALIVAVVALTISMIVVRRR